MHTGCSCGSAVLICEVSLCRDVTGADGQSCSAYEVEVFCGCGLHRPLHSCQRRFSHFLWLRQQLPNSALLPPLSKLAFNLRCFFCDAAAARQLRASSLNRFLRVAMQFQTGADALRLFLWCDWAVMESVCGGALVTDMSLWRPPTCGAKTSNSCANSAAAARWRRRTVWLEHGGNDFSEWERFSNVPLEVSWAIKRDVSRTYTSHPVMRQAASQYRLGQLLQAYKQKDVAVGYCQGINNICGFALLYCGEWGDAAVLKVVCHAMGKCRAAFLPGMVAFNKRCQLFALLMSAHAPKLHQHLLDSKLPPCCLASQWLLCAFCVEPLSLDLTAVVWDGLLCHGVSVVLRFALALCMMFDAHLGERQLDTDQLQPQFQEFTLSVGLEQLHCVAWQHVQLTPSHLSLLEDSEKVPPIETD